MLGPCRAVFLLLCFTGSACALKILFFLPLFGVSHVRFSGKLVDILAQAGHNITVYQPVLDDGIKSRGFSSKNVTYYTRPRNPGEFPKLQSGFDNLWDGMTMKNMQEYGEYRREFCTAVMNDEQNLAALKAENFDLVVTEWFEACGYGVIEAIGAQKYVTTWSGGLHPDVPAYFGVKRHFSYSPDTLSSSTEKMTFFERVKGIFAHTFGYFVLKNIMTGTTAEAIRTRFPNFDLHTAVAKSAFIFVNSEDHVDYVIPRTPKVITIPNMDNDKPKPLTGKIGEIVESQKTRGIVLFSFGSVLQSSSMPAHVKAAFLEAFKEFPDVTFFWKYEKPEDGTAANIPNVFIDKWLPQRDLLYHPKILAFITHGGQNSLNEASSAGVPLLALPVFADQHRNRALITHRGIGFGLDHQTITKEKVVEALREILNNKKYKEKAQLISRMIQARPLSTKESFIKHIEFAAEFGDTGTLSAEGANQNVFVLYSLDVIAFLVSVVVVAVLLVKSLIVVLYRLVKSKVYKNKVE
uniref:glucuronosyltransferase n=1 Tax=Panagrellus redivivus TaxID=6233 RepID=A0A7E4VB02_PANRE